MSASSNPTRAPSIANAAAMFAETVLLPTPPFPEATAIAFFTVGNMSCSTISPTFFPEAGRALRGVSAVRSIVTSLTPGMRMTAALQSSCILPFSGQAIVVSANVNLTAPSDTAMLRIIPSEMRSRWSSGSFTLLRASTTISLVTSGMKDS
ncbi:MAG: hypothetical protein BWY06_02857 [Candidatus Latescibacteria bacterium ADurb.Bin168]|nr:MAG: hypothetical protein BWY06_02857 [Candidatus Latescibacteria bacterium ADurb.Bin168]